MDKFLLLQVRNCDDPMREQEVDCFARALECRREQIRVYDLLSGVPTVEQLDQVDLVLLGGSGDYSVAEGGEWLPAALAAMRELYELSKPTFASCWGFQAMAKALGGEVITDKSRAELGTVEVRLTAAGRKDPLFAPLGDRFLAPMGHQDCVVRLPPARSCWPRLRKSITKHSALRTNRFTAPSFIPNSIVMRYCREFELIHSTSKRSLVNRSKNSLAGARKHRPRICCLAALCSSCGRWQVEQHRRTINLRSADRWQKSSFRFPAAWLLATSGSTPACTADRVSELFHRVSPTTSCTSQP